MLFNNIQGNLPKEILLIIFEIYNKQIWENEKKRIHDKLELIIIKETRSFSFRGTQVDNLMNRNMMITVQATTKRVIPRRVSYKYYYVFGCRQIKGSRFHIHCEPFIRQ
jgi:hypothetical protein